MDLIAIKEVLKRLLSSGLGAPILLMMMLGMMVIPLPPFLLDILFTFNISLALIILLATIYVKRPLEFVIFPTVLLLATLLRLSLNIASTRVVLLEGHTGTGAAGQVIKAFGEFVVGGNTAVGLVIFLILVIINFLVVTKGATRVAEVSARFTLDSMPGKQMAIDADLNAGLINQEEAKLRREEVANEADFYGSMDGAGKFVRGDAVAGILILVITILGGLIVGMLQHDMAISDAMHNYTLLTIGDGLVAQIPSLLLSTAAGLMVTRASVSSDMGGQILGQLFQNPKVLVITATIVGIMGLIPGMPNFAFLSFAAIAGAAAYWSFRRQQQVAEKEMLVEPVAEPSAEVKELSWDDVELVDMIGLEVGYRLIPMVDRNQGGQLMGRIKGVRKKLSQELGFLIPSVHIRDNLDLAPSAYRITLMGVPIGESEIQPERDMAINPGQVFGTLPGIKGTDPAFGLEAVWIEPNQNGQAQNLGYTVVDSSTVVATHLSHILHSHAAELLGHEEVQHLLDNLAKSAPKLVEDLVPKQLSLGGVLKVLQSLLQEGIPIRDMRSIAETLAEHAPISQDAGVLTSSVRVALGRSIVQQISGIGAELPVLTLDPSLEQILHQTINSGTEAGGLEPGLAENLHQSLIEETQRQEAAGRPAVLLVSQTIRTLLSRFVRHSIPTLHVLAFNEIPDNKQVKIMATVGA